MRNCRGRSPDAVGTAGHGAGPELIIGDGGAFDGAPDEIAVQTIGQVAAIEPVGPLPQVAREVLRADTVMSADKPGFDVAEQRMDDREELAGVGAFVLDHRGMSEVLAEGGIAGRDSPRTRRSGGATCSFSLQRGDVGKLTFGGASKPRPVNTSD